MKTFIVWLMGDNLGIVAIDLWHWLWQLTTKKSPSPQPQTSNRLILECTQQLLDSISTRVTQTQGAVEKVRNSTRGIQRQYDLKCQEYQEIIGSIEEYQRTKNTIEARSSMARAIVIERIIPELKKALENSQYRLATIEQSHAEEQAKLALLEIEMLNIRAYLAMNDLVGNNRENDDLNRLQARFSDVQIEIEDRYHQFQIMSQLSHSANCILEETLNPQDLDDRIAKLKTT